MNYDDIAFEDNAEIKTGELAKPDLRNKISLPIKKLTDDATIPTYAHKYDAGMDLYASEDVIIESGETAKVPTGIAVNVPANYELQIRPRSGLTLKTKLRVQLGTIDSGYTGEIGVIVDNIAQIKYASVPRITNGLLSGDNDFNETRPVGKNAIKINKGDRIAQAVLSPVVRAEFQEVDNLGESERGDGGYGSTGY